MRRLSGLAGLALAPEVDAVDVSVSEEQGAVVRVVVALARDILDHGVPAGDDGPLGGAQGMEVGLG